jgi:hypothetical protein
LHIDAVLVDTADVLTRRVVDPYAIYGALPAGTNYCGYGSISRDQFYDSAAWAAHQQATSYQLLLLKKLGDAIKIYCFPNCACFIYICYFSTFSEFLIIR